ncbi:hypothetical protein [Chromobacterium vaccinii]|uniref:hypothetical protein n=1 Tax=Chromobacterium vaccinii TaxID=1108595 RepID=UPI001E635010|nr:hypothetical protein [Chromobacterium vaccinii]MCD4500602.1 hypothetical protein [Chromobacterium vaccinii]
MQTKMVVAGLLVLGATMTVAAAGCAKQQKPDYPVAAMRDDVAGVVKVTFKTSADGSVSGIRSATFSAAIPPQYRSGFRSEIAKALREYRCAPSATLSQEFDFKMEE